jgi:DNA invertase Pin-like site-specific DNA recombinase
VADGKTVTLIEAIPGIMRRLRVAAYARVSSARDAMKHSLSAQVSHYSGLIQQHWEWEFAGVYADEPGMTGTKDKRPEFQRMLADCRAGLIDMIITKSVTRFARNTVTTLETVRALKALGVDVFFEKENIHSMSGDGELMLTILASYAQEESLSASENQKWRVRKKFEAGRLTGCRMLGYRLKDGVLTVVPEEAELVKQIFTDYLSGMGVTAIMKKLRLQGVTIGKNGISGVLRNEKYQGDMLLQKSFVADHISKRKVKNDGQLPQYLVTDSHQPIISKDMFAAVQAEIVRRAGNYKSTPPGTRYPLTGIVICGICGAPYKRKHAAAGTKYEKIVWICPTFDTLGKDTCGSQQIPEDILLEKAEQVGGLDRITEIRVPEHNLLTFVFTDGTTLDARWENPSRRHSWTLEMKQAARERQLKTASERRSSQ